MTDKIVIPCSECGSNMAVPGEATGKKFRCPKCKAVVSIPAGSTTVRTTPQQAGSTSDVQPRRARRITEPQTPVRKRRAEPDEPADDEWLDDGASSYEESSSEWDEFGTPPGLPPRRKQSSSGGKRLTLPGGGNEPPAAAAKSTSRSILTGILMMVGAVIWFGGGLALGRIFFYPPIMFVLGIVAVVKGVMKSD